MLHCAGRYASYRATIDNRLRIPQRLRCGTRQRCFISAEDLLMDNSRESTRLDRRAATDFAHYVCLIFRSS
jgi:hypothetical protein